MKRYLTGFLLSAIFLIFSANTYAEPIVNLQLSTTDIYVGDSFYLNVYIDGVDGTYIDFLSQEILPDEVTAFGFHILESSLNSTYFSYLDIETVVWPGKTVDEGFFDLSSGLSIDLSIPTLVTGLYLPSPDVPPMQNNILLATLTFQALQATELGSNLSIGIVSEDPMFEGLFTMKYNGYELPQVDLTGVTETFQIYENDAAPVPEPATMLLLGAGLIGLAGIGRRKFKS